MIQRYCLHSLKRFSKSSQFWSKRWTSSESDSEKDEETIDNSEIFVYRPAERPIFRWSDRNARWRKYQEEMAGLPIDDFENTYYKVWRYPQFDDPHVEYKLMTGKEITLPRRLKHVFSSEKSQQKGFKEVYERGFYHDLKEQTVDFLIMGAGIMGTFMAYALKDFLGEAFTVLVVDRDLEYSYASSMLSLGGIRQQFSHPRNIELARKSAEFFRTAKKRLACGDVEPPDIDFHPMGYLILVKEDRAEKFLEFHKVQTNNGIYVELLSADSLKLKYPWLNTDGIVLASFGMKDEGWINPYALLKALRGKAEFLGVQFMQGEVFDFNPRIAADSCANRDDAGNPSEDCHHCLVRLPHDWSYQLDFTHGFVATGAESTALAKRLGLGIGEGMKRIPYPVVPRKRYVYLIHAPYGPVLDFPILVDPSGVVCRRDGLGGHYVVTKNPSPEEEPDPIDNIPDDGYFHEVVHPILANRVKGFDGAKLIKSWAGFVEENVWDGNPIIGTHPYFDSLWWAGGFGTHAMQMAPAVCQGLAEAMVRGRYEDNNDLSVYHWIRLMANEKTIEELSF